MHHDHLLADGEVDLKLVRGGLGLMLKHFISKAQSAAEGNSEMRFVARPRDEQKCDGVEALRARAGCLGRRLHYSGMDERRDDPTVRLTPVASFGVSTEHDMPAAVREAARDPISVVGRYIRVRQLGAGGMGVVWLAWDIQLRRYVALKLLSRPGGAPADSSETAVEEIRRFYREARTAANLRHPNIVTTHDVGEQKDAAGRTLYYISMEYVDGHTLDKAGLSQRRAIEVLRDAARGVDHAHVAGVVHRDLKPQNIMIDKGGHAFVMDFGLAKRTNIASSISASGDIVGTPAYMPPEQATGRTEVVGVRSDVYALGATLYAAVCGGAPYRGASALEILQAVTQGEPARPRTVNPRLHADIETIILRAMERDPMCRYATAQDLADDLDRYLTDQPVQARPMSTVRRVVRQVRRYRVALALGALAALCVAAGIALVAATRRSDELTRREREEQLRRDETTKVVEIGRKRVDDARLDLFRKGSDLRDRYVKLREAIELFEKVAATSVEARYQQGLAHSMIYAEQGDDEAYAAAERAYTEALRMRVDFVPARLGRGLLRAERLFDDIVESFFSGTNVLRRAPERQSLEEAAIADLDVALRERVGTPRDRVLAEAAVEVARGAFDRAERVLSAGIRDHDEEDFYVRRARLRLVARRDYAAALADAGAAREKQANMPSAIIVQYSACFLMARFEEARRLMGEMLAISPGHAATILTRAMLECYMRQYDRALADAAHPFKTDRLKGRAKMVEAFALSLKGSQSEALKRATEALELCKGQPFAHVTLAAVLTNSMKLKEAEEHLDKALEMNDEYPAAYSARSMVRMVQMRLDGALADAERAIELDTFSADALTVRGIVYLRRGEREKARADLRRAVKLNPFQKKLIEPVLKAAGVDLEGVDD